MFYRQESVLLSYTWVLRPAELSCGHYPPCPPLETGFHYVILGGLELTTCLIRLALNPQKFTSFPPSPVRISSVSDWFGTFSIAENDLELHILLPLLSAGLQVCSTMPSFMRWLGWNQASTLRFEPHPQSCSNIL